MGVGITISAGEILDPLNDLVERFSWLALVASASLGTQMLLTEIAAEPAVSLVATAAAAVFLLLLWWPGQPGAASWALRALALVFLFRFLFSLVALTVGLVDAWVLEARQQAAMTQLTQAREEIEALRDREPEQHGRNASLLEQLDSFMDESRQLLDLESRLNALQSRAESAIGQLLELIVLFLVQTLVVPIGAFWLALTAFRTFLRRAGGP